MPTFDTDTLTTFAAGVLERLGTPPDIAAAVATWLVRSDLTGHESHGVAKVADYANRIRTGTLRPDGRPTVVRGADDGPAILVDGGGGYGHPAAHLLTGLLVDRVRSTPVAVGGIVNASHTGRLGEWAEQAAAAGAILLMTTASTERGSVAGHGAREPRLGTNPIAAGVPGAGDDRMVLDFATSQIAGGRLHQYQLAGQQAPEGALIDRAGNPTTDPAALAGGGMLVTFGGHKGYGLSLLSSVLAACVVNEAGPDPTQQGVIAIALDPAVFADRTAVLDGVSRQLEWMRSTPPRPGFERVLVPGDFERDHEARSGGTVVVPEDTWAELSALAESVGAEIPGR